MDAKKKPSVGMRILEGLREFTEALEQDEPLAEKFTCHKVTLDLQATTYNAALVKETRQMLGTSQALFAKFLGVSVKTVSSWEQGVSVPNDMACRFMDEMRGNPEYWQKRFKDIVKRKQSSMS